MGQCGRRRLVDMRFFHWGISEILKFFLKKKNKNDEECDAPHQGGGFVLTWMGPRGVKQKLWPHPPPGAKGAEELLMELPKCTRFGRFGRFAICHVGD